MMDRKAKMNKADKVKAMEDMRMESIEGQGDSEIRKDERSNPTPELRVPDKSTPAPLIPHIMLPMPDEIESSIPNLIDKAQFLALESLVLKLQDIDKLTPSTLMTIITQLQDMKISTEWTAKLRDAIAKKARLLYPPNAKTGGVAKKLSSIAGHTQDANKLDGRDGTSKLKANDLLLPPNDPE